MGLDGVEIIMEVEDRFDISIADDEAEKIYTVGHLTQTIQRKLGIETRAPAERDECICPTAGAFYRLRRVWSNHPVTAGVRLRPSTELGSLSSGWRGWWARQRLWTLARRAGVRLPPFGPPNGLGVVLLLMIGFSAFAGLYASLASGYNFLVLLSIVATSMLVLGLQQMFMRRLPPGVVTVGDALRACEQPDIRASGQSRLSELELEIIQMVGDQLGYDPAIITLESRFVEDLDMD